LINRKAGGLFVEQVSLEEIAETYGTPTFVYSEGAIRSAWHSFDKAFDGYPHEICYAVKANSNIAILQLLADMGSGFDIVSGGELTRVLRAGGNPAKVVFSGVGKQHYEIEQALAAGIGCFNVESASELNRISEVAKSLNQAAPVSIRVNPDVDPGTHPYISTGLKENKFGVNAEEAMSLYRQAAEDTMLEVVGMDCHIGSQITSLEPYLEALTRLIELAEKLNVEGISFQHFDLGGGLGIRYQDETPIDEAEFASAITQAMSGRSESLMFEPGRLIVGNAGLLLTRVNTLKSNGDHNFAIVDAAMNDLIRPALYEAWQEVVPVRERSETRNWDLVGPVCETGDFLARSRQLALAEDDLLAILSCGAYGFVMSSNYNSRNRAAEILVCGERHFPIRRRELKPA
jgi:diaminopimelate decarboxylase